nr:thyroid adenoma-associated protein homolog isoform X1 [Oncorhynchus nerka]
MVPVQSVEDQMKAVLDCVVTEDKIPTDVSTTLKLFMNKLDECSRSNIKRCKERSLEEAGQLLRKIPVKQLQCLEERLLLPLIRLLVAMQMQMFNIASRKLDQMLQHLAEVNRLLVFREIQHCLCTIVGKDQALSIGDLQIACMFLEDSSIGRELWRETCPSLIDKVAELFPVILEQEGLRNGPLCYQAVKVCLQVFQLLPGEVAPLVWEKEQGSLAVQSILQSLMDIILGQCSNRDTRLLAGTTVAMLINTVLEGGEGGAAAWSLLQVTHSEPWQLCVGGLQVQCIPCSQDGVDRLAVSRGLLTCCRRGILVSQVDTTGTCLLLGGLFPLVSALCEEKLDCHYYVFEVLTLWLKSVKECLAEIWEVTSAPLLPDDSSLRQQLIQVIWDNAESPVEGVSEVVRSAFCLLLEIYEMDCQRFGDTQKNLHISLLHRITKLPWEAKAKYFPLCSLLPYVGTDMVLEQYSELPNHLLKCMSTNHLSPCASELYKCMIQKQRCELCEELAQDAPPLELDLANQWARRWRTTLLEALTSDVTLLQNNSSSHLLPWTLRVFPAAVEPLLAPLDPASPGHLHAWACVMSARRATYGGSPWALESGYALETLRLALGCVDDRVRLAALNLLCCSPKTKEAPTPEELSTMRTFIPQNLNSESSPFRQHLQAGVKRFLVRIRDSCLAHLRGQKGKRDCGVSLTKETEMALDQGVGFVDWLSQLMLSYLAPGHSYQRKKTVLLLLSAVLETCTDTWSPDKKKGQPPVNMASLINWARLRGWWDFFSRSKQLVLIGCLEDSTNEIRELSAGLLVRFFPPSFLEDITPVLFGRAELLLCSPRVPEAQMGALIIKVLLQKSGGQSHVPWLDSRINYVSSGDSKASTLVRYLLKELEQHYLIAKDDMMLAARTKPIHGILTALERCILEVPNTLCDVVDHRMTIEILVLLERITLLLLGVLYGDQDACGDEKDIPPSFCDMGNAITSLIGQVAGEDQGEGDECVLLSEEHSLVLTCCWVSLKEIGIFLGSLVERILAQAKQTEPFLTLEDLKRASKVFKNILLKCRHWGAVEGCCVGFTRFCACLLSSSDPELRDIPAHMLKQGLEVLQSRCTSVTRRAAGLPMLILCVVSAEEASKARPLLAHSIHTLLDTARSPLPQDWDQTLDLPQVCAVHTLQALVRGSGLGVAVLQFAPAVAILSLTLLSSPCWAMRNAALQLYSSLCSRLLGQRSGGEEGSTQHGMSPPAFFTHYPALQPFLLGELRGAAEDLQGPSGEARLRLHPSLYPVLTLLAKLQRGVQDQTGSTLSDFLIPLLQLAASPVYSVRVMTSKALVAMTPPCQYVSTLLRLTGELPEPQDPSCHNRLHGQLLQIRAILDRGLCTQRPPPDALCDVVDRVESRLWLVTGAQHCPLVRGAYLGVAGLLRGFCSQGFLLQMRDVLLSELHSPHQRLQVGSASFHQNAIHFLCAEPRWACQVWGSFSTESSDLRLSLVSWAAERRRWSGTSMQQVLQTALQANLKEALLDQSVEYSRTYLTTLIAVMTPGADHTLSQEPSPSPPLEGPVLLECVELLLGALEGHRGGPEFLSQALCAASLLLSQSLQTSLFPRWCSLLEVHRVPEAPEALRRSCAGALCLAGAPLLSMALRDHTPLPVFSTRLINTGLYLLQDESQQVRIKAAGFASTLCQARRGGGERSMYLMQVNQALPFLLELLLEECWDSPGALEVLLCHMPQSDLSSVLTEVRDTGCASLYEQDEANVFAEPSVMSACLLPYLLQLAEKYPASSVVGERLGVWARENVTDLLENLRVCKDLQPGDTLDPSWLALLMDSSFHGTLCGLWARAAFLLRLLEMSDDLRPLCDPESLRKNIQEVHCVLRQNGVQMPAAFTAALTGDLP